MSSTPPANQQISLLGHVRRCSSQSQRSDDSRRSKQARIFGRTAPVAPSAIAVHTEYGFTGTWRLTTVVKRTTGYRASVFPTSCHCSIISVCSSSALPRLCPRPSDETLAFFSLHEFAVKLLLRDTCAIIKRVSTKRSTFSPRSTGLTRPTPPRWLSIISRALLRRNIRGKQPSTRASNLPDEFSNTSLQPVVAATLSQ